MLVSHAHRFIYLKGRKCAGTSVEMALEPFAAPDPDLPVVEFHHAVVSERGIVGMRIQLTNTDLRTELDHKWFNHISAAQLRASVGEHIWSSYRRVAVVRNPFDRMVSYFHWDRHASALARAAGHDKLLEAMSFDDIRAEFSAHVRSETWPTDEDILFIDGEYCIDHTLRFEGLPDVLTSLATDLGLDQARVRLPVTKVTQGMRRGRPVADYFDCDLVDIVRRRMAYSFERFGYSEDPLQ